MLNNNIKKVKFNIIMIIIKYKGMSTIRMYIAHSFYARATRKIKYQTLD